MHYEIHSRPMGLSVCAHPGCPTLTHTTRCDVHTKAKRRLEDKRRPSARQRGYNTEWERTRSAYLAAHPLCEDETGCIERATDVDHIDGLGPKGPLGHSPENLRALCGLHHKQRTARDQPGGWNT